MPPAARGSATPSASAALASGLHEAVGPRLTAVAVDGNRRAGAVDRWSFERLTASAPQPAVRRKTGLRMCTATAIGSPDQGQWTAAPAKTPEDSSCPARKQRDGKCRGWTTTRSPKRNPTTPPKPFPRFVMEVVGLGAPVARLAGSTARSTQEGRRRSTWRRTQRRGRDQPPCFRTEAQVSPCPLCTPASGQTGVAPMGTPGERNTSAATRQGTGAGTDRCRKRDPAVGMITPAPPSGWTDRVACGSFRWGRRHRRRDSCSATGTRCRVPSQWTAHASDWRRASDVGSLACALPRRCSGGGRSAGPVVAKFGKCRPPRRRRPSCGLEHLSLRGRRAVSGRLSIDTTRL